MNQPSKGSRSPNTPSSETPDADKLLASYDYELPLERIAQNPAVPRDSSRLLVVDSPSTGGDTPPLHRVFRDLPDLLQPGDLLVLNNTRVINARLLGRKPTGAPVEVLLLEERSLNCWLALVKPGRRLKPGATIFFEPRKQATEERGIETGGSSPSPIENPIPRQSMGTSKLQNPLTATVLARDEATGGRLLQFDVPEGVSLVQLLDEYGNVPLPPYINDSQSEQEQYQTVYAASPGAIAAPTAGLHFTPTVLTRLQEQGINTAFVTLHVGVGTFRPVEVEDITTHQMHAEWVELPKETVDQIHLTKSRGGRVIAVGTTVVRTLEGIAHSLAEPGKESGVRSLESGVSISRQATRSNDSIGEEEEFMTDADSSMHNVEILKPYYGKTNLFIYPGYEWQVIDGLITNFHLPRSSLLMLVSALIGRERLLALYREAIAHQYRFYSFGDAMLILPEAVS